MKCRIFGSCVTRDAFEFGGGSTLELEKYYARSSFASAFSQLHFEGVNTEAIPSPFQRRIVEWDLRKEFSSTIADATFDYIVVDLIDERFDLLRCRRTGALATRSNELMRAEFSEQDAERIVSGSAQFFELWQLGWRRFVEIVDKFASRRSVILHKAYWAGCTESGTTFHGYDAPSIERANRFLDSLYECISKDLPGDQIIAMPSESFVGADGHRWGPSPFHYRDDYYRQFVELLVERLSESK